MVGDGGNAELAIGCRQVSHAVHWSALPAQEVTGARAEDGRGRLMRLRSLAADVRGRGGGDRGGEGRGKG